MGKANAKLEQDKWCPEAIISFILIFFFPFLSFIIGYFALKKIKQNSL
jgi:hypothetical protein